MSEKKVAIKTKCYYTDYVNHMIRFYLSTPDGLDLRTRKYTKASINNWSAVQIVFLHLDPDEADKLREIYTSGMPLPKSVEQYATGHSMDIEDVWKIITKFAAKVARVRELV